MAVALGTLPATFSALVIFLEAIAAASFGWLLLNEAARNRCRRSAAC